MRASPRTCLDLLDSCEGPVSSVFWLLGLSSIECGSSNYWSKCFEIIQAIFLFETSCDDSCFQFFSYCFCRGSAAISVEQKFCGATSESGLIAVMSASLLFLE
ncbi:uncharacterized protein [Physcomitrium patens]|uniref:uncharacterized protein isoform X2 n=1 Tax=Physcomitrium patens TaxID=3218 RepID=UPI003CCDEB1C